ncbi:unnamed protein product [Bursaphelenchus xylophilus]|uniref:(pine wood nematode) hypothetical protein n=1 Tax=Bursaphelenchus xylophilus TaxID=6326 RepID=A0A1I7SME3_BURXY|nr:unnamed protein product [Bursaphelenchus xylophilus]CAG9130148.1 unnamed protein product [Bursaphelenchus xylophilus]
MSPPPSSTRASFRGRVRGKHSEGYVGRCTNCHGRRLRGGRRGIHRGRGRGIHSSGGDWEEFFLSAYTMMMMNISEQEAIEIVAGRLAAKAK